MYPFQRLGLPIALAALLLPRAALGAGLRTDPISGASTQYLDGDDWTAEVMKTSTSCTFEKNVDYASSDMLEVSATDQDDCCRKCGAAINCSVGVFTPMYKQCYLKSPEDVKAGAIPARSGTPTMACSAKSTTTGKLKIPASVPGDLITDLQTAGTIGDPLYEMNFLNGSDTWNLNKWTYTKKFTLDVAAYAGAATMLVFDGIKMGAHISLNGKPIGVANDQFLRYVFTLPATDGLGAPLLRGGGAENELTVTFDSGIDCEGRWMACTGGWDWAPYSYTTQGGTWTFSKGIWKSVYLTTVSSAAITSFSPLVYYKGAYPTTLLTEHTHGGFTVAATVNVWSAASRQGTVSVRGAWGGKADKAVSLKAGNNSVTLSLDAAAADVKLWWPNGMGEHPMYNITATYQDSASNAAAVTASRRVGFRFVALVTGNDTDASYVQASKGAEGTDHQGMLFRVNGGAIFARGANMIPMEELEGRMNAEAHTQLVRNAADAQFNMLRVWGGGMFLPDAWYDACDDYGVMVFHDMQYAQSGHAPKIVVVQDEELRYQIRRLSAHPSIVIWDGCNECQVLLNTGTGIYASFVMTVVAEEDASRAVWPSCPARGWAGGVEKLTARPVLGKPINLVPHNLSVRTIETHGPYQHGSGFSATNGHTDITQMECKSSIPINIEPNPTGLTQPSVFASEFGCVAMSSFESMSPTLAKEHWGLHAGLPADNCTNSWNRECHGDNPMSLRNYPCDNLINNYFGNQTDFDEVGEHVFKKQLWQCMMAQALELKGDIETRRSQNTFGIIVWQFNEIWPTGGWGTIEYGTPVAGQVIGGRWKPAQYWYKKSIYADVMGSCGQDGNCFIKNDSPKPFAGKATVAAVNFMSGKATVLSELKLDMPAGAGVTQWFKVALPDGTKNVLTVVVTAADGTVASDNLIPLVKPSAMLLPKAEVTFKAASAPSADGTVKIDVTSDKVAMWVTLTTLAQGRFSDNAFLMLPGTTSVTFVPFKGFDIKQLQASLRVEHVASY